MISIIIPTYNRDAYLIPQLRTLRHQTYQDYEVIVVDDGGNSNALKIVQELNDDRIKYIWYPDRDFRLSKARNTGSRQAIGDILVHIDCGILLEVNFLMNAISLIKENPNRLLNCYINNIALDYFNNCPDFSLQEMLELPPCGDSRTGPGDRPNLFDDKNMVFKDYHHAKAVWGTGNVYTKQMFNDLGGLDESFVGYGLEDIDFALVAAKSEKYGFSFCSNLRIYHLCHVPTPRPANNNWSKILAKHPGVF